MAHLLSLTPNPPNLPEPPLPGTKTAESCLRHGDPSSERAMRASQHLSVERGHTLPASGGFRLAGSRIVLRMPALPALTSPDICPKGTGSAFLCTRRIIFTTAIPPIPAAPNF